MDLQNIAIKELLNNIGCLEAFERLMSVVAQILRSFLRFKGIWEAYFFFI